MIENGVRELWYFVRSEVKKLGHIEAGELQKHISILLQDLGHHQRCLSNTYTKYMHTMHKHYWTSIKIKKEKCLVTHQDIQPRFTYFKWVVGTSKGKKHNDLVLPSSHTVCTGLTFRSIMTDLYHLSQADGSGDWREKEAKDLSDLVQNRITYLQVNLTHTFMQSLSNGKHDNV